MRICIALALGLSLLSSSCAQSAVEGFAWKAPDGRLLRLTQSSRWPRGEEGSFGPERRANRYSLEEPLVVGAALALELELASGERSPSGPDGPYRVKLELFSDAEAEAPSLSAAFPLRVPLERLVLNLDPGTTVGSLGLSAEGAEFQLRSISFVPPFSGLASSEGATRVSSDFSQVVAGGTQLLSLSLPPAESGPAGILVAYGPGSGGARIEVFAGASRGAALEIRAHEGGGRTVLGRECLPEDASALRLSAPASLRIESAYAEPMGPSLLELADLGRVLLSRRASGGADFDLYRWEALDSVLVLDFADYATQDRYLKRLAFFVEKKGYRGRLAADEEIAALHGWNAHDYRPEDLAAFFNEARRLSFPLNAEELALRTLLLERGLVAELGGRFEAGRGSIISISRESNPAQRERLLTHEATHALFFADAEYRGFVTRMWASMPEDERWFWKFYFGWMNYDTASDYLMASELQAYLIQQPLDEAEEYFTRTLPARLLERHPERASRIEAYMERYSSSFAARARALDSWLSEAYDLSAGSFSRVR